MMVSTVYIVWSDEKRKIMEAQWCTAKLWGEIRNFVFNALTSKTIMSGNVSISPNFYIVQFTWWGGQYCSGGDMCDKIILAYSTSTWDRPTDIKTYKTLDYSTCQMNTEPIKFYWSWVDTNYIIMNKWFSPRNINKYEVFFLSWSKIEFIWDAIIWLCLNSDCTNPKEIWKFAADARSQTISTKNCKYYDENNPAKCKTREDCTIYDSSDSTKCVTY